MKSYSKEFRGDVVAACDKGRGTRKVATYFNVSESWVRLVKQERRELNKVAPCLTRRRTPLWAPLADRIRGLIRQQPDLTLRELKAELKREQPLLNPDRLVFIDETWAKTTMTRPRGRASGGVRLLASVPHGHWKTTTFLAAFRTTGLTAPLVVDGAINGELFLGSVRHRLVPTLQSGDVVVMDNLGVHKVAGVRERTRGAPAASMCLGTVRPEGTLSSTPGSWRGASPSTRAVHGLTRRTNRPRRRPPSPPS